MSTFTIAQLLGGSLAACFRDTEYFVRGFSSGVSIIGCKFSVSTSGVTFGPVDSYEVISCKVFS